MTKGIYCYYDNLRCKIIYVGKDSYIDKNVRHRQHYQPSKRDEQKINQVLQNDNKSGRYSYAVLEQGDFTNDELNQKEISWIAFFKPFFCFTEGGDGAIYWKGKKLSKEHREKISKNHPDVSGRNHPRFNPCIKIRKQKHKSYKQGFRWAARPYTPEGGENFYSVTLIECMKLVKEFIDSDENIFGYDSYEIIYD